MQKYKNIILDFDGTIADSLPIMVRVYNELSLTYKVKPLSDSDVELLRGKSIQDIFKELDIPIVRLPLYLYRGRKIMKKNFHLFKPIPGIISTLKILAKNYSMGIVTSNDKELVLEFMNKYKAPSMMFVHSEFRLFKKHKALQEVISDNNLQIEESLYIGDEIRDIISTKKIGMDIASVSWGYNNRKILEKFNPKYIFDNPKELLSALTCEV